MVVKHREDSGLPGWHFVAGCVVADITASHPRRPKSLETKFA
jgi:hypothetical protein